MLYKGSGTLSPDWSTIVGDVVLDMATLSIEGSVYIVVLGTKCFYILKQNGGVHGYRKLAASPVAMHCYVNQDSIMILIAAGNSLLIFFQDALKW